MQTKMRWMLVLLGSILLWACSTTIVQAEDRDRETELVEDFLDEDDMSEIEELLQDNLEQDDFSFRAYVMDLVSGKEPFSILDIGKTIKKAIYAEWEENLHVWKQCFFLAFFIGFFANFSTLFRQGQVGDTGSYVGYFFLFSTLVGVFSGLFLFSRQLINLIVQFMKVLLPVYFMMTAASNGQIAASGGYHVALLVITIVDMVLKNILLPAIEIYFFVVLIDQLSKEDQLSKLQELLENGLNWTMKGLVGVVTGMNVIQGLLLPAVQRVKQNIWLKTGQAIPVVGNVLSGAAETVLSVACLLRNAVGVAGVVGLLILCAVPLLKIGMYVIVFRVEAAVLQPLGAERLCDCFVKVSKTAGFLFRLELVTMLLFGITILLLSVSMGG